MSASPLGVPAFAPLALKYAKLGIPVELIEANTKRCRQSGWENTCSADPNILAEKIMAKPEWTNYALVAKAIPGGHLFLDDDGGIRELYEAAGFSMEPTLKQKSCSGKFHYIYKQSPSSLAFYERTKKAYIGEKNPEGELWSLRMNNAYIVGAGSVVDGKAYELAFDAPIVQIPDTLLNFLIQRWEANNGTGVATKPVTNADGNTPIFEGGRNNSLASLAGKLYRQGLNEEEVYNHLSRVNQEQCRPPLGDDEVKTIAHSIAGTGRQRKSEVEAAFEQKIEERAAAVQQNKEIATKIADGLEEPEEETDSLPPFPQFSGSLHELAVNLFPDIPYEFKFMAAVTHWGLIRSGLDSLANEPNYQPRFYMCLVAKANRGKTAAINEIRRHMGIIKPTTMLTDVMEFLYQCV